MIIYILTFIISLLLYNVAVKIKDYSRYFFLFLSIAIPSLLAACRDLTVGTDILAYVDKVWDEAILSKSFLELQQALPLVETGYLILNYAISRFTNNIETYFFIHQFIVSGTFILLAYRNRDKIQSNLIIIFYFLFYYNECLSMMRMVISLCLVMWACQFYFEKKYIKASIFLPFIFISHGSGIFALMIPLIFIAYKRWERHTFMLYVMITIASIVLFYGFQTILQNVLGAGYLMDKYDMYINQENQSVHKVDILFFVTLLGSMLALVKKTNRDEKYYGVITLIIYLSIVLTLFGSVVEVANRVVYYLTCPIMLLYQHVTIDYKENRKLYMIATFLLIFHFGYLAFTHGIAETIPYTSKILGI